MAINKSIRMGCKKLRTKGVLIMASKVMALILLAGSAGLLISSQTRATLTSLRVPTAKPLMPDDGNLNEHNNFEVISDSVTVLDATYEVVKQTVRDTIIGLPRGIRQNNPGNIRPGDNWNGMTGQDGGYLIFRDVRYGIRAMVKVLRNYQRLHNLETVKQIIYRWAPPADNNPTNAYVKHVAEYLRVATDQPINVNDHMLDLIKVMAKHENGGNYLTESQIREGIEWAGRY